jgi:hypothetical protein
MGRLDPTSPFTFLGPIGNISVYKRRDLDKVIVRYKGGPSKRQIKESEKFEKTRRINAEFGGRSIASSWIMFAMWLQKPLADFNIAGPLNSLLRPVQELDTENEKGKRTVLLSRQPSLLEGFDLNRKRPFASIVRNPLRYTLSRAPLQATIDIPALLPGINLQTPGNYPMYSFIAILGVVPDCHFTPQGYQPSQFEQGVYPKEVYSDWYPVLNGSAATTLEINIGNTPPWDAFTLILSIGIRFGTIGADGNIQQVKYAGSAKILAAI